MTSNCRTKSGKSTKKKKKVHQDNEEGTRDGSLEKEELENSPEPQDNPPLSLASPEEDELEDKQPDKLPNKQPDKLTNVQTESNSLKPLALNSNQRNTASLRRRPKGPAPPPPPPGSKTMTLGRIKHVEGDVIVKSRGFTVGAAEGESGLSPSDEVVTKPRSASDAVPPPTEKEEVRGTYSPTIRHRPIRKAPSRPAPSTPQSKTKAKTDNSKAQANLNPSKEAEPKPRSGSLTGSPRRRPPTVPPAQTVPLAQSKFVTDDIETMSKEETDKEHVNFSADSVEDDVSPTTTDVIKEEVTASKETDGDKLQQPSLTSTSSKPPSVAPKPKTQRHSPGQSPSGRRKEAATVICKDTKDGGKELIVKPSPHSKRKFSGPLIFKMPPPPSTPPSKAKAKKPPMSAKKPEGLLEKKAEKKDGAPSFTPPVEDKESVEMDMSNTDPDSSIGESTPEMSSKSATVRVSSPKSLSDTLISNEFTNLDELLSDSHEDIVTTDFSIAENLEPVDEYTGLEWNESGLPDSSNEIPYQDPEITASLQSQGDDDLSENMAAALNLNTNNNNSLGTGDDFDDIDYEGLPPPPVVPPHGSDSDKWELESNNTGELNLDSSSSTGELMKESIDDGVTTLEEEMGTGGVVLLNVKGVGDDVPVLPEETKQDVREGWTGKTGQTASTSEENGHLIPASVPLSPSIGTQLSELDDVVSSLCLLYTSPSPRDATLSRMPSSA